MKINLSKIAQIFIWLIFFGGFLAIQIAYPQSDPPIQAGENARSMISGNQNRNYILYVPAEYDGKTALPLVFLFHGSGGSPKKIMESTGLANIADKKKFFIAAPEGLMKTWNIVASNPGGRNEDVNFVKALIEHIGSKLAIDKRRIYAVGMSKGATFSSRLGCDLSNDIAAIGGAAGVDFFNDCISTRALPVIHFFGTEDTWYSNGDDSAVKWAEKNGCQKIPKTKKILKEVDQVTYVSCKNNAEVIIYRIEGGGHVWPSSPDATNLIWNFFEAHPMP